MPVGNLGSVVADIVVNDRGALSRITKITAGLTALGAVGATVVSRFVDFETQMNRVKAVTGATADEMQNLEMLALRMGSTTVFTAREAAEGLAFLGQAGFSASEQLVALPEVLNLASAGMIGLGEASDIATNILKSFQEDVRELGRFTDVLALTAASSNTNILQLGDAMRYVGPVARLVGLNVESTSAALGVLGDAGLQATVGGTALRGILLSILDPTREAANVFEQLGVATRDHEGDIRNYVDVLEDFRLAGATAADFATVFGRRFAGAADVIAQSSDNLRGFTNELGNAQGAAEEMANIQLEGLSGALTRLGSALDTAATKLGGTFSLRLQNLIEQSTELVGLLDIILSGRSGRVFELDRDLPIYDQIVLLREEVERIAGTELTTSYGADVQAELQVAERAWERYNETLKVSQAEVQSVGDFTSSAIDRIVADWTDGLQTVAEEQAEALRRQRELEQERLDAINRELSNAQNIIPNLLPIDPLASFRATENVTAPLTEFERKVEELGATLRTLDLLSPDQREAIQEMANLRVEETSAAQASAVAVADLSGELRDSRLNVIRLESIYIGLANSAGLAVGQLFDLFSDEVDDLSDEILAIFGNLISRIGNQALGDIVSTSILRGFGLPGFQSGGFHRGGFRFVGERGPELELTGPSRILSNEDTRRLLGREISITFAPTIMNQDAATTLQTLREYEPEFIERVRRALTYDSDFQRGHSI